MRGPVRFKTFGASYHMKEGIGNMRKVVVVLEGEKLLELKRILICSYLPSSADVENHLDLTSAHEV